MSTKSDITICIPHWGAERYLKEALQSVSCQTTRPYEIIISLDTPISELFLAELELQKDIRIYENFESGIGKNWNHCIQKVRSHAVVLLHSDDRLDPDYIEHLTSLIKAYPDYDAWGGNANIIDESGNSSFTFVDLIKWMLSLLVAKSDLRGDDGLSRVLSANFIYCPALCYKTKSVKKLMFRTDLRMTLDVDFYSRLLLDGGAIWYCRRKKYHYRRHLESTSARLTKSGARFNEEKKLYAELYVKCLKFGWSRSRRQAFLLFVPRIHRLLTLLR
jgi:glycosyltransferase involved in cell wall biosynthesis